MCCFVVLSSPPLIYLSLTFATSYVIKGFPKCTNFIKSGDVGETFIDIDLLVLEILASEDQYLLSFIHSLRTLENLKFGIKVRSLWVYKGIHKIRKQQIIGKYVRKYIENNFSHLCFIPHKKMYLQDRQLHR